MGYVETLGCGGCAGQRIRHGRAERSGGQASVPQRPRSQSGALAAGRKYGRAPIAIARSSYSTLRPSDAERLEFSVHSLQTQVFRKVMTSLPVDLRPFEPTRSFGCVLVYAPPVEPVGTILFLHGIGEAGDDPAALLRGAGLPREMREGNVPDASAGFRVVCPQTRATAWETEVSRLRSIAEAVIDEYPGSPVILTGFSTGAEGALAVAAGAPDLFAGVLLVSVRDPSPHVCAQAASALHGTPVLGRVP